MPRRTLSPPSSGLCQHGHQAGPQGAPSCGAGGHRPGGALTCTPVKLGASTGRCLPASLCRFLSGFSVETLPPQTTLPGRGVGGCGEGGGAVQGLCALRFGGQAAPVCAGRRGVQELPDPPWRPLERGKFHSRPSADGSTDQYVLVCLSDLVPSSKAPHAAQADTRLRPCVCVRRAGQRDPVRGSTTSCRLGHAQPQAQRTRASPLLPRTFPDCVAVGQTSRSIWRNFRSVKGNLSGETPEWERRSPCVAGRLAPAA